MIIGLHGRLQAGKDTTYERMADMYSGLMKVQRLAFADPLYESAAASIGVTPADLRHWKMKPEVRLQIKHVDASPAILSISIREYLQLFGTEGHRNVFGQSFWVDQALDKATDPDTLYVITDCRFENEAQEIYRHGGYVIEVVGPEGTKSTHASEVRLGDEYIYDTIDNTVRDDAFQNLESGIEHIVKPLVREASLV
jgi:hypothetical protein